MLLPDEPKAASNCEIVAAEKAGWSQRATSAASNARENWLSVAIPVRRDEAMPSAQADFSAIKTVERANSGRIFSALAPTTTTTGQAGEARAASTD